MLRAGNTYLMHQWRAVAWDTKTCPQVKMPQGITSSMNTMEGAFSRAREKSWLTSFSLSPSHLETRSEEDTLKKVDSASVATAFARYDLPVPGGPYSRMPLHGFLLPGRQNHNITEISQAYPSNVRLR